MHVYGRGSRTAPCAWIDYRCIEHGHMHACGQVVRLGGQRDGRERPRPPTSYTDLDQTRGGGAWSSRRTKLLLPAPAGRVCNHAHARRPMHACQQLDAVHLRCRCCWLSGSCIYTISRCLLSFRPRGTAPHDLIIEQRLR